MAASELVIDNTYERGPSSDHATMEHAFVSAPSRTYAVFSPADCDRIIDFGRASPAVAAGLAYPIENYRVARSSRIEDSRTSRWIFERLVHVFDAVNTWYGFDIEGIREPLLFCEYPRGGRFEWHADCGEGVSGRRKISLSIQLSNERDYTGGGLEFALHGELVDSRGRGTAIAFPAFTPHRVLEVTSGMRHALVAWAHGPPFR